MVNKRDKGHQDDKYEDQQLDAWARLNIEMDALPKTHWQRLSSNRPAPFSLPLTGGVWSLWIHGQRLTTWDKTTADLVYFNASARKYWQQKYDHFETLDYEAIWMAYKSLSLFYQLRIPKWITKRLPVGKTLSLWKGDFPDNCPRCGIE